MGANYRLFLHATVVGVYANAVNVDLM
jgi:hypothetical protein